MLHGWYGRMAGILGRPAKVDAAIPNSWFVSSVVRRLPPLARGLLRFRSLCFIGANVSIMGKRNVKLGRSVSIGPYTVLDGYGSNGVELGPGSRLGASCVVTTTSHVSRYGKGFSLGARSGMGDFCHIGASGGVRVGDDVLCGSFVSFHSQEHVYGDPTVTIAAQGTTQRGIEVGDNVWIGAKATILDGTTIGSGSVVAAGAVVKGSFPANSVLAGVPARRVRDTNEG